MVITVSGEVARIRVHVVTYGIDDDNNPRISDRELFRVMQRERDTCQQRVDQVIYETLGPDIRTEPLIITQGSVEVLVVLTTVYRVIKDFNEYMETLGKAAENVRRAITSIVSGFGPFQFLASSSHELGTAFSNRPDAPEIAAREVTSKEASPPTARPAADISRNLILYVLASNLVLTVALLVVVFVGR